MTFSSFLFRSLLLFHSIQFAIARDLTSSLAVLGSNVNNGEELIYKIDFKWEIVTQGSPKQNQKNVFDFVQDRFQRQPYFQLWWSFATTDSFKHHWHWCSFVRRSWIVCLRAFALLVLLYIADTRRCRCADFAHSWLAKTTNQHNSSNLRPLDWYFLLALSLLCSFAVLLARPLYNLQTQSFFGLFSNPKLVVSTYMEFKVDGTIGTITSLPLALHDGDYVTVRA